MGMGWKSAGVECVLAKAKKDDTNDRFHSGYDIHMYPQWVNNPLQGLDRCVLTVGAI